MSDAHVVGSAAFVLRANRDQLKKDLDQAERDLKQATGKMEAEVGGSTGRIGGMIGKLGLAVGALSAAFAAGLAMAIQFGRASLEMADTIANGARRIGISTDALQEWQHVARRTGADANQVAGDIENFTKKFEQAAAGVSKDAMKPFDNLRFSQQDLRNFEDADQALESVMDRIYALQNPNDRSAMAEKFGLSSLASAAREGADEVDRLRDEAQKLGFVMDAELIRKGADAQEKLDGLSRIIGIQMAEAFIGLSDEVLTFTGHIADAMRGLNNFLGRFDEWRQKLRMVYGDEFMASLVKGDVAGVSRSVITGLRNGRISGMYEAYKNPQSDSDDPALMRQQMAIEDFNDRGGGRRRPNFDPNLRIPHGRTDNSAQRAAEREARRAERVEQEIYRLRAQALGIVDSEMQTAQQRFNTAQAQLKIEREAEQKELESRKTRGDITAKEFARLSALNKQVALAEDRVSKDLLSRDLADERLAQERLIGDLTRDLLSLQSGAARTAEERRRIEMRLLQMAQDDARKQLVNSTEFRRASKPEQDAAIARQEQVFAGQRSATNRANQSPLDAWRDQSLKTISEVDEAYERIAANGLDALNDGIVDAIMGTRTLGEVFSSVAKQILADLLQIGVRRSITEPLADALFGGAKATGSGGSNLFSTLASLLGGFKIPGFASGVTNFSGGLAYVHQGELLANLAPGTSVIPANVVNGMGGGSLDVRVTPSPYFDVQVQQVAAPLAQAAGVGSFAASEDQRARAARNARFRRK